MFGEDEENEEGEEGEKEEIEAEEEEDNEDEDKKKKDDKAKEAGGDGVFADPEREKSFKLRNKMKDELLELEYGVYRRGLYVRVEIENIKFQNYKRFKGDFPIILCRINPAEDTFGFLKV